MSTRELRDYQQAAVDAVYAEWDQGATPTAVVMATGLGKTDVIGRVATEQAAAGRRVLALAHRDALCDQIDERCTMHRPDIAVGRVDGTRNQHRRPITVAMVQSMNAKRRSRILSPAARQLDDGTWTVPGVVIVDECHHASSPSYVDVLDWAGCMPRDDDEATGRPLTPMVGVTATLTRADKRGLGMVFRDVAFVRDTLWAIEQQWLVRPIGRVVVTDHMNLDQAKVSRGDYQDGELGDMVAQDVDQIVKAWLEHASDRITVAFTPNVASAQALAAEFRAAGVPVGEVYGNTPLPARDVIYAALARGELRVMVGVMVATEGWDCPPVSCVLQCRPTKQPGLYTQMVGRGLRLSPETGKTDCLVLDVVGASRTQRLVTLAELHPAAPVNTDELDLLPCERCGGYVGTKPAVVAAGQVAGLVECACPCGGCGALLADCTCAPGRDPNGGRRKLFGPATYAEVDLLGLAESRLRWLATNKGVPFSVVGDRFVVLWPDSHNLKQGTGGTWRVGHISQRGGDGQWVDLETPHPLGEARELAARWAGEYFPDVFDEQAAPWHTARRRASDKQVLRAQRMGIADAARYTVGAISDAMDVVTASRLVDGTNR